MSINKKICNLYIKNASLIGALYLLIPLIAWIVWIASTTTFREVYLIRIIICLIIGVPLASYFNKFGLNLWIIKHNSKSGPATIIDGLIIGGSIGFGIAFLPSLTSLIFTNDIEQAKTFIIVTWILAGVAGAIIGSILASIGQKYLTGANTKV